MKHVYYFLLILFFTNVLIAQQVQVVPGIYSDLTYVSSRDAVYALRLAQEDGSSNQLYRIDAATGEVLSRLDLDGDPSLLRPTSSGDYIYIAFRESNRVVRVDLTTDQIDQDFTLGGVGTTTNRFRVADLLPVRGSDERILVSSPVQCCDPAFTGLALVEDGTLVALLPTDDYRPTTLAYTDRDDRIVGFDNTNSTYGFSYISVADEGIVLSPPVNQLFEGGTILEYDGNQRAYTTGGTIINLGEDAPEVLNQIPVFNNFGGGFLAVEADLATDKVYYLGYGYNGSSLLVEYDATTLEQISAQSILPNEFNPFGVPFDLELLSTPATFAFLSGAGTLGITTLCTSTITEVPPPYTGSTTICPDQTTLLLTGPTEILAEGQTFLWSDGQLGDSILVSEPGTYSYRITDDSGCPGPFSDAFFVNRQDFPDSPPFIQDPATTVLCAGATVELIGSWFYENSITWNTGLRSDTLLVTEAGSYTAQAVNPFTGCVSETSAPIVIEAVADSVPPAPIVDQGTEIDTCTFEPIILSVSTPAQEYFWRSNFLFATGSEVPVYYNSDPTVLDVTVRDFNGCVSPATTVTVRFFEPVPTPTIEYNQTSNTLAAFGTLGPIQWYRNGVFEAETQRLFYQPEQSGFYTARARGEQCLSDDSNIINVEGVISAVTNLEQVVGIDIFPNPVHDELTISVDVPDLRGRILHYELVSVTGSLVRSGQLGAVGLATPVSVAELAPGMYVLRLRHGAQEVVRQRVVVF